ncbi:MAG: hypothetical protein J0I20_13365 [Chloroflexi bacterium]|nr:hypothetical protein [Chloroflexota bacterium]OJV92865.1 MAG: hypothetical protein BGO39_30385 [Chloroflexi bacterium 54-19]
MKPGKTFGPETPSNEDDIEQIFELSRSEEKANWADFRPTLDRLRLNSGQTSLHRRAKFFSLPRLVMAGMAAVIVVLALGLVTITLLTPKEVTPTPVANQPVPPASTTTPLPANVITLPPTISTAQAPVTANGPVSQATNPTLTPDGSTNPTQAAAVPTKLAIQTPIGAVANTPVSSTGSPVTIFGTLLSLSGNGNNTVLNVRTTEGVVVVKVTSATSFDNPDAAKGSDLSSLVAGTTLSATGTFNAQGQLEATTLTLNPQDRPPLVTPGFPDDTK